MSNLEIIKNKINSTKKYLKIVDQFKGYTLGEIKENVNILGAVERYSYLMAQSTIDLAEAVVVHKTEYKIATMSEAFQILKDENIIDSKMEESMTKMVGFRNVLAHDYEDVNHEILYDVVQNKTKDIENFIEIIKETVGE